MMTAHMWRNTMKNKYHIGIDDVCDVPSVCINLENTTNYLRAFLIIEVDDEDTPSPFKTVEDAKLFAEIIVKLLNKIGEIDDIE